MFDGRNQHAEHQANPLPVSAANLIASGAEAAINGALPLPIAVLPLRFDLLHPGELPAG